jgi:ribosome biogenesis GTPase / thiamine phosphate phosphatase
VIEDYGWSERLQRQFAPFAAQALMPGRVIAQHRDRLELITEAGETSAEVAGRLAFEARAGELPCVGDWVAAQPPQSGGPALVRSVLERRTAFTRRGPLGELQVIAANADLAFVVLSLEGPPNLRRLERYLTAAWASGADPLVLLTKADLDPDVAGSVAAVRRVAAGAPVIALSVASGDGLPAVGEALSPGVTAVMVGASGAGKSTLANALLGELRFAVGEVRADDKRGRHTTTRRELVLLPGGGLLLDTPGMRELALDDAGDGLVSAFDDIEALAAGCRFGDCAHESEPGCAVRVALEIGELDEGRWRSFQKLRREAAHQAAQEDPLLREERRKRWIAIHKANRARYRARERE